MLDPKQFDFCSEFYTVEKTIEVVAELKAGPRTVRIEALRGEDGKYSTRAYTDKTFILQPDEIENSQMVKPQSHTVWVRYDLPWTKIGRAHV